MASSEDQHPILFFDGHCGLCDKAVSFAFARDAAHRFRFAPLQGETARRLLPPEDREAVDSMVLWERGETFRRSTAALRLLSGLGGLWRLTAVFYLVPRSVRDRVYEAIAKRRYRFFGRFETCRLIRPEERGFFLD